MSGRAKFSLASGAIALVAVLAVALPRLDLGDDDGGSGPAAETVARSAPAVPPRPRTRTETRTQTRRPTPATPPANPDEVKGNEERSLARPANLRRALAVLEPRRRAMEGIYDGLRIAPGRIDTTIENRRERLNIQVRTDFRVSFESRHDFPNRPDYRRFGMAAADVDVRAPARILRKIDSVRRGDAARDLDYVIIRRDIIDFRINVAAYLRSGATPRYFSDEADEPFRPIG